MEKNTGKITEGRGSRGSQAIRGAIPGILQRLDEIRHLAYNPIIKPIVHVELTRISGKLLTIDIFSRHARADKLLASFREFDELWNPKRNRELEMIEGNPDLIALGNLARALDLEACRIRDKVYG